MGERLGLRHQRMLGIQRPIIVSNTAQQITFDMLQKLTFIMIFIQLFKFIASLLKL